MQRKKGWCKEKTENRSGGEKVKKESGKKAEMQAINKQTTREKDGQNDGEKVCGRLGGDGDNKNKKRELKNAKGDEKENNVGMQNIHNVNYSAIAVTVL